uniref:NR LBD domain-containing protein n=1 Tax=Syphacia muris TaxID=451379 RepID=A0A0N5B0I8_9BILA
MYFLDSVRLLRRKSALVESSVIGKTGSLTPDERDEIKILARRLLCYLDQKPLRFSHILTLSR